MFHPEGPSLLELLKQALSSTERGYDLLAPKFDRSPFRTPDAVLDATAGVLRPLGPFGRGLDVCCGTGAGMRVISSVCRGPAVGIDFSAGASSSSRRATKSTSGSAVDQLEGFFRIAAPGACTQPELCVCGFGARCLPI